MKRMRRLAIWGVLAALCFAGAAFAQDDPFMQLYGLGNGFVPWGDAYVSPYQVLIGVGSTTPVYAICDDFSTDISVGDTWFAIDNSLSSVGTGPLGGPQKFKTPDWPYTIQQEYDAAALLAEDLMQPSNMNDPTLAGEYSYAIWSIFDPDALNAVPNGGTPGTGIQGIVESLVNTALADAASGDTPDATVSIYTPTPNGASQEFLVVTPTPEASLLGTLGVELMALLGVVFVMRRRLVRTAAR